MLPTWPLPAEAVDGGLEGRVLNLASPPPSPPLSRCYDVCSFEKRHRNLAAHLSPAFPNVKEGDIVTVGQVRRGEGRGLHALTRESDAY